MKAFLTLALVIVTYINGIAQKANSDGWINLFDGKTFTGWRASENPGTFTIVDGMIVAMKTAKKIGIKHFFIEDESSRALEQVPQSLAYLKTLK